MISLASGSVLICLLLKIKWALSHWRESDRGREPEKWRNISEILIAVILACHTPIPNALQTSGLAHSPSPPSPSSTLTCGSCPTNSTGMTRPCCLSTTIGRKPRRKGSHISSRYIWDPY
ncbi:hypothetical protein MA16_Dca006889 [Dendrobium catenatum]|uniref:Uncharacterized protein n=1 Tax=Dendrobium catenatum TaxID=906689 RepID=A0A2I0VT32_9ASPA|nr:hypothetical protein MA16_Dca006889 [Dendrobium catenatum]